MSTYQTMDQMQITTSLIDDEIYLISLSGEVDVSNADFFKNAMVQAIDQGYTKIIVDFSDTSFIDSTTLGVLISGTKRLRPSGGWLGLVCSDPYMKQLFSITSLDKIFPIHPDRPEAIQALKDAEGKDIQQALPAV